MILINILVLLYLQLNVVNAITLNAIGFSFLEDSQFYTDVVKTFNTYSEKNNLDINVKFNLLTSNNSTVSIDDFISVLDTMYNKHSTKYDIIFYEFSELKNFDRYFLDLNKWLTEEHKITYYPEILSKKCTLNNKLIGLPMTLGYTVLYYNKKLLDKYGKRVPKTWDELIETSLEIKEKEKKKGNINLSEYNGLFSERDVKSYFEFIYSFRNSTNSPYPEVNSKETREAFEMIMKMKNKLSSGNEFSFLGSSTIKKLTEDHSIFLNFWTTAEPYSSIISKNYNMAPLPGGKEGISATSVNGYNVGINSLIENIEERRDAAIEVVKYITSKEMIKKYFLDGLIIPAIPSIFDDEEVCKVKDCELYKNLQPLIEIPHDFYDKYKYEEIYGKLAASYVFKNKDLSNILNKIEDITKIYHISLGSDDHYVGLIIIIFVLTFSTLMFFSLIFTFIEKLKLFFKNFSKDSYFLLITGFVFTLCSALTRMGIISVIKCHLKILLTSIGFILYLVIILYELIINFPVKKKICNWIKNHKYLFLSFFLLMDFTFNGLSMINPFSVNNIIIENGCNYQICEMTSFLGKSMIVSLLVDKFIIFIVISFLIFIEWDIVKMYYEVRFIFLALYSNFLFVFIAIIFDFVHINYFLEFIIQETLVILMSITNYIFLYGYRIFLVYLYKKNMGLKFINNASKSDFFRTQTKHEYYNNKSSIIGYSNNSYNDSYNNNSSTEQMIVSSPPRFFTKMYNHYLRESSDNNFIRSF